MVHVHRLGLADSHMGRRVLSDILEFERDNHRDPTNDLVEMLDEFLQWNGIAGYSSTIRSALWELISNSHEYITNTDQEKEEWLKKLLGVS